MFNSGLKRKLLVVLIFSMVICLFNPVMATEIIQPVVQPSLNTAAQPDAVSVSALPVISENETPISDNSVIEPVVTVASENDALTEDVTLSVNGVSENSASENSASENSASENEVSENSASENEVSENTVSEDTVSGDTVSEDETHSKEKLIKEAKDKLRELLENKSIMAVVYNCDYYTLKDKPGSDGKAVVDLPSGTTVYIKDFEIENEEIYFLVTAFVEGNEYEGYIKKDNLISTDEEFVEWDKEYLSIIPLENGKANTDASDGESVDYSDVAKFPVTYREKLTAIKKAHPAWVFIPQDTGISFSTAVNGELSDINRNWVYSSIVSEHSDYANGKTGQSNWYYASKACLNYYMDPRNYLTESRVFAFEQLTYNSSYHTESGVQAILGSTFMSNEIPNEGKTYANAFYTIGSDIKVSPYHLASRVIQEQGSAGSSEMISGTNSTYPGVYNYFNIGASGSTSAQVLANGLKYAKDAGWTTRYKSLSGGANYIAKGYINKGQDTLYSQKYNVTGTSSYSRYSHQYMQNVSAAYTEAVNIYKSYKNAGSADNAFVFKIPVFTDMNIDTTTAEYTDKDLTLTVTKVRTGNTFDNTEASMALYSIATGGTITSVTDAAEESKATTASPVVVLNKYENGRIYVGVKNVTAANYKKLNKKLTINVTVKGYSKILTKTINVAMSTTIPKIKGSSVVIIQGFNTGVTNLTDSSNEKFYLPSDVSVACSDSTLISSVTSDRSGILLTASDATKRGSKKLTLTSSTWNMPITLKVSLSRVSKPSLMLSKTTVVINKNITAQQSATVIKATIKGTELKPNTLVCMGGNTKTSDAITNGALSLTADVDGNIKVEASDSLAKGTYKVKIVGTTADSSGIIVPMKTVNLTVKVVETKLANSIGLSRKGKINLTDRTGTDFLYTPSKLANLGSVSISSVVIDGSNSSLFGAEILDKGETDNNGYRVNVESGAIMISANSGAALNRGKNYTLPLVITLDNGVVVNKTIKVKPVQSVAKTYVSAKKVAVYTTGTAGTIKVKSDGAGDSSRIASVEKISNKSGDKFNYTTTGGEDTHILTGNLSLADSSVTYGTYTVYFNVNYTDSGENVKPKKVSVKVVVQ
ncbi:MAG: hypothetical protein K6F99_04890 [Lachnospiraceae bacterium]|nr:hypothetical protein [Lachnospiraceae bacterium]